MKKRQTKKSVKDWLDKNGFTFVDMTDDEKLLMRKELNICGAKTKGSRYKFPCVAPQMLNGRCKMHGGTTPKGAAASRFKTGEYSSYLPKGMKGQYEKFLGSSGLNSLRDEIAVSKARSADLMSQLNERGDTRDWEELSVMWQQFRGAMARVDRTAINNSVEEIETMLSTGAENFVLWDKISASFELTRRLEATEAKMLNDAQMTITAESGMAFAYAVVAIVQRRLKAYMEKALPVDKRLLSQISEDVAGLSSRKAIDA